MAFFLFFRVFFCSQHTGWRVGWAISTPEILKGLTVHHTSTSYCAPSPLQHGLSVALESEDGDFEVDRRCIYRLEPDMTNNTVKPSRSAPGCRHFSNATISTTALLLATKLVLIDRSSQDVSNDTAFVVGSTMLLDIITFGKRPHPDAVLKGFTRGVS